MLVSRVSRQLVLRLLAVVGVVAYVSGETQETPAVTTTGSPQEDLETTTVEDIEPMIADAVNQMFKMGLPVFMQFGSDPQVSTDCSAALVKTMLALRRMEPWAIRSESLSSHFDLPHAIRQ